MGPSSERRPLPPGALARANLWLKGHFIVVLSSAVALGALWPGLGLWLKDLVFLQLPHSGWSYDFSNLALGAMMLSASVNCELKDFEQLITRPRASAVSVAVVYGVVPALAYLGGLLGAPFVGPEMGVQLRLGLMLSALMPVAMTSSVWVRLNSGNLPLLLALITLTSALALASVPVYLSALLGVTHLPIQISSDTIVQQLVLSATVPLLLGLALRRFAARVAIGGAGLFSLLGTGALWAIVVANVAVAAPHVLAHRSVFAVMVVLTVGLNVLCYAVGLGLSRLFRLAREDAVSLLFGSGMRSNSTGLVIGLKTFSAMPLVVVPAAIYMISQHVIGAYLTRILERTGSKLLGPAIASEPRSLESFLDRALPEKLGKTPGLALVVFEMSGSKEQLEQRAKALVRGARTAIRLGDFVCQLSPHRFGVVLVNTQVKGTGLVVARVEQMASKVAPALQLRHGFIHSVLAPPTAREFIDAAALGLGAPAVMATQATLRQAG